MATAAQWIEGARLRTLPMAIAPVMIGSAAAADLGGFHLGRAVLALVVALALQVGVNYANDYSDGIRGTDDVRVGPLRLTGSGAAPAATVKAAAFACFGVACLAGLGRRRGLRAALHGPADGQQRPGHPHGHAGRQEDFGGPAGR